MEFSSRLEDFLASYEPQYQEPQIANVLGHFVSKGNHQAPRIFQKIFFKYFVLLGPHPWHMEVPRLGV